jgi:hypothetical protein
MPAVFNSRKGKILVLGRIKVFSSRHKKTLVLIYTKIKKNQVPISGGKEARFFCSIWCLIVLPLTM